MNRQGVVRCPGCGLWSRYRTARLLVDRVCIKCGRRTRVSLERKDAHLAFRRGRGRPRATEIRELPLHMPGPAVKRMVIDLNKWERRGRRQAWQIQGGKDTFVKASEILEPGTKAHRKNLREMPQEEYERIQSLDDFLAEEWDVKKR